MYGAHDEFPHLAVKLTDQGHKASQGTTSYSSAAATARNSINQYVTDIATLSSAG